MAVDQGMIMKRGGVQADLDGIFKKKEFRAILWEELVTCGLKGKRCLQVSLDNLPCTLTFCPRT